MNTSSYGLFTSRIGVVFRLYGVTLVILAFFLSPGALAQVKQETTTYHDDLTNWKLGQVASVSVNGTSVQQTTFDALSRPIQHRAFGALVQSTTYSADGTVATIGDGNGNITTISGWKRGKPLVVRYPATAASPTGATVTRSVSDYGLVESITDENGYTTSFGYDPVGRLASIAYPAGDTTAWNVETFSFTPVPHDEHGLAPGHWTLRHRVGDRHMNTYYDAMWRPVLEESLDYADIGGTLTQVVQRFDQHGQKVFRSYPKRNVDRLTESQGSHMTFDALGRLKSVSRDSEHGLLTTLMEYLPDFKTRTTNARNVKTIAYYQTFDLPTYDSPIAQDVAPDLGERAITDVERDIFGKPTVVRRRNGSGSLQVEKKFVYDGNHRLCKTVEPETGATVFGYDVVGNLTWSASGLYGGSYGSATDCNHLDAWNSGRRSNREYDSMSRITSLTFPDGRGNQSWTYEADGLPASITTNNFNGGDQVINRYFYNKRRLPTGEQSEQPGWYTWGINTYYDGNASIARHRYPTGLDVYYAPNALGQPTHVYDQFGANYASGASYYPNGAVKQFTYGNGIVHSMSQNARQLPQDVQSSGGVFHDRYAYDGNGNVSSILDVQDGGHLGWAMRNRYLSYDGLDRLTDAGSGSFGGDHWHRFTYDALDNMKSWKLAGVKDYAEYVYDAQNRLGSIKNSGGATVVGFGYDPQGNLQNKNGQMYSFDYGNRLREVAGKEWFYRYDGLGRRVLSARADGLTVSMYGQAGELMYYEQTGKGNFEQIYLGGSLLAIRNSGVIKFQHTDALGSPIAVTDTAGAVIERNNYEPYGAIIGKPTYDAMGFTGHKQDGATGLTYMQQRYYSPETGLFLSTDPVSPFTEPLDAFHRYRYANSNPYTFVDPDGRFAEKNKQPEPPPTTLETVKVRPTDSPIRQKIDPYRPSENSAPSFFKLTTFEALKRGVSTQQAVDNGALTRTVTMPAIIVASSAPVVTPVVASGQQIVAVTITTQRGRETIYVLCAAAALCAHGKPPSQRMRQQERLEQMREGMMRESSRRLNRFEIPDK